MFHSEGSCKRYARVASCKGVQGVLAALTTAITEGGERIEGAREGKGSRE